jgi:chromosome segregation ATPase
MGGSIFLIFLCVLVGSVLGAVGAWFLQAKIGNRRHSDAAAVAQKNIDHVTLQRNGIAAEYSKTREQIKSLQALIAKRNTELTKSKSALSKNNAEQSESNTEQSEDSAELTKSKSALSKSNTQLGNYKTKLGKLKSKLAKSNTDFAEALKNSKVLAKNVLTLRSERDNTKIEINTVLKALESLKQQTIALQTENEKVREFYKRELTKSFEKRKRLEKEVEDAQSEQKTIAKTKSVELAAAKSSPDKNAIAEAQLRLGQLEVLERTVTKLEAENEELNSNITRLRQEVTTGQQDIAELEELRINNKQLVRCVEGLEGSRKEHESDAERYRAQADQSEKLSDTLRFRLDDLQKNFAEIEKQQGMALTSARVASVAPLLKN